MDERILCVKPGSNNFLFGPALAFPGVEKPTKMVDAFSQFSLDGLTEDEPDSVVLCEEEKEVL